jgi:GH15 family glucan-1,4-alpha-glucosidase
MTDAPALGAQATGRPAARASVPIADYGLLSDCSSAALVSRDGSIDWLCLPRFDSPSVFARLLDPDAGHWSIAPAGPARSERRYLPGTLVIETTFRTEGAAVRVTDALAFPPGQRGHDLGHEAPHELLRLVDGIEGSVELAMELAPRAEYGLVRPLFRMEPGGGRTFGGPNRIGVRAGAEIAIDDATMASRFTVAAGESVGFALRWAPVEGEQPRPTEPADVAARIEDAVRAWQSWESEHDVYDGPHSELVRLSSRVLKGLSYRPTGAIVAAPTTSLPETVGGERNWDYRYTSPRTASCCATATMRGSTPTG